MQGDAFLACRIYPRSRNVGSQPILPPWFTDLERMVEKADLIFYFISISGLIMFEFDFILLLLFKLGKEKKLASI